MVNMQENKQDNTVIVLDTPADTLSQGTKQVVNERIKDVINSGGENGESVNSIEWTSTEEL